MIGITMGITMGMDDDGDYDRDYDRMRNKNLVRIRLTRSAQDDVRNGDNMKTLYAISLLALLVVSTNANERTPEELANAILQDRVATCPRVGFAKPNDDVFLMELDVNTFQAALESKDMKLKALVTIKASKSMPYIVKDGENPLSEEEKEKRFRENPQYKKLKAWYLELVHEDQ